MVTIGKVHAMKFCTYCGKYSQAIITFKEDGRDLIWIPCFTRGCSGGDDYPNYLEDGDVERLTAYSKPTSYKQALIRDNGEISLKA